VKDLTVEQRAFVRALVSTNSVAEAARQADVAERTARRWMNLPAVQAALNAVHERVLDQVVEAVSAKLTQAVETLVSVMESEKASASARVSAAAVVVNALTRLAGYGSRREPPAEVSADVRELHALWERVRLEITEKEIG